MLDGDGHLYASGAGSDHRLFRSQELVADEIFSDGFESGSQVAWSASVP